LSVRSQITGTLSPWCGVFSDSELKQYEYSQDLRYYYGMGPGTDLSSKMMLPYLKTLVGMLAEGPVINGTFANGTSFTLPKILTAFMNDGQITELGAVTGIWDNATVLSGTEIPEGYEYISSHFVSMRGTVAFERLNCAVSPIVKARSEDVKVIVKKNDETVTITICPTQTGPFATYTEAPQQSSTSTFTTTEEYTITTCAPTVTNCPVGKKTSTVVTGTTVVPIENTTVMQAWTSSATLVTSSYTVTSCAPTVTACSVGEVTSSIYETVTWCPVTAAETDSGAVSSAGSGNGSGSGSGSASITTGSTSGSGYGSGSSNTASGSTSGYSNTTASAHLSSSLFLNSTATPTCSYSNTASTSSLPTATPTSSTNQTYIRILINDAVYPVPSCQDGPGRSCLMSEYVALIQSKVAAAGDLRTRCNVTNTASPTVLKGASFYTDLADSWLAQVAP
jgi:hypothetical protein